MHRASRSSAQVVAAAGLLLLLAVPPRASGQAAGPVTLGVDGDTVTIRRDSFGVPHVFAATERGLYFGNGYAVAQDRLAQMEKYRRTARGEMAELSGAGAVASDRETRTLGYTDAERQAQFDALEAPFKVKLQGYVDGVNAWIQAGERSGFPPEVRKLAVPIRPWKVTDSAAIGEMMARRFGGGGGGELRNLQVLAFLKTAFGARAQEVFDDLAWQNDPAAPATIPASESPRDPLKGAGGPSRPTARQAALAPGDGALLQPGVETAALAAEMAFAAAHNLPTRWGSYAMAVSPSRRVTGTAALVGGPQMGFATPQIAHEIHLSGAGLEVIGMGFGGIPGVLIGHNEHLAWTTTTGVGDVEDIFAEQLDPADPHRYRFKGEWRAMERRVETIRVRDGEPVTLDVYRTVHGPVIQTDEARHLAYAKASGYWMRELGATRAIDRFNRAKNLKEFAAGVSLIATSHNWLCATQEGDIGYWFGGRFPVRAPGLDPRLPTPGEGDFEWRGFREPAELPQCVNPKQGWLANWNNKPAVWWQSGDTPAWGPIHRVQRIFDQLAARENQTADDLRAVLRDISDFDDRAPYLKPLLAEAAGRSPLDSSSRQAARLLRAWDNHGSDGSVGKQLFETYVPQLRRGIFGDRFSFVPQNLLDQALSPGVLLRVIQGPRARLPMKGKYLGDRSADEVQATALANAVAALAKDRGPDPAAWGYRLGRLRFEPLPSLPAQNRGTYIQIVELTRPLVRGVSILPPGQNEDPASRHYGDQREMAGYWLFKPMILNRDELGK